MDASNAGKSSEDAPVRQVMKRRQTVPKPRGCLEDPKFVSSYLRAGAGLLEELKQIGFFTDPSVSKLRQSLEYSFMKDPNHAGGREIMFSKVLTPYDVKLERFVVSKDDAEKYFPMFPEKGLLLHFEDPAGKLLLFRYSYENSSNSYVLTEGWSRFVKAKQLDAGDTVHFYRGLGEEDKHKLFISWSPKAGSAIIPSPYVTSVSAFPFAERIVVAALAYGSLFPPDHEFEKDTLLQLWIAVGITVQEPMENEAGFCFEYILKKGFFQFCGTNLVTGKPMYKLRRNHESIQLEDQISDSIVRADNSSHLKNLSPEVSHVSISCRDLEDSSAFSVFKKFEQLRTLIFLQGHELSFKQVPRDFFLSLKLLRVLDLSRTPLEELPSSIGNMNWLCYIDLSDTPIKRLPEAIHCLTNLQTLKLRGCLNLSTLPKGMRKLVNLRHLEFDVLRQLRSMPPGMGVLTKIQTLSAFLVGGEEEYGIGQLKNMINLSGSFCISKLENVLTEDEAVKACLWMKSQIIKLELCWTDSQDENVVNYEKVLSSLRPSTSLEELCISCYGGLELPRWVCNPELSKLVSVTLFRCENCLVLPSLGQLPSLKLLDIVDFHKLKVIDQNFCSESGIPRHIVFPKLESLTMENMLSLEEWYGLSSKNFPRLVKLTVKHCPKLHSLWALSRLSTLTNLEISYCTVLASCLDGKLSATIETLIIKDCPLISEKDLIYRGSDWSKISHIPQVWIDDLEMSSSQTQAHV